MITPGKGWDYIVAILEEVINPIESKIDLFCVTVVEDVLRFSISLYICIYDCIYLYIYIHINIDVMYKDMRI